MNKKYIFSLFCGVTVFWSGAVSAFPLDEATMHSEVKSIMHNSPDYKELVQDSMQLSDVNGDGFVSDRELLQFIDGLNIAGTFSEEQKQKRAAEIVAFFNDADVSGDKKLSADEFGNFWADIESWMIKDRFRQMDRNNDGVYDEKDIPSMEESLAKLEETSRKLKEASEQLKNFDADEFADKFLENSILNQLNEDYYQMDKNGDNCVTKEEFAEYNANSETNLQTEFVLSKEDYMQVYDLTEKKDPNCLTKEEYIADAQAPIDDDFDMDELKQEVNSAAESSDAVQEGAQAEIEKANQLVEELQKNQENGVKFSDFEK